MHQAAVEHQHRACGPFGRDQAAFLDQPGEFCIDRASGRIDYLPRPGEDPAAAEAIVPRLTQLLRLDGAPERGRFVDNVPEESLSRAEAEKVVRRLIGLLRPYRSQIAVVARSCIRCSSAAVGARFVVPSTCERTVPWPIRLP